MYRLLTAARRQPIATGFTLVEMLVAIAITLVMMAAVVTLFANVSGSVRNRRATVEMSGQIRHVRNVLQQDLQGATCPGSTWQRPESNHGYIELIEGAHREGNASSLIDGQPPTALNPEIDHAASSIPSSNLPFADPSWATDGAGLGDFDDILMLTVRNEIEPFVGRAPKNLRPRVQAYPFNVSENVPGWDIETIESPLAEVVWFAIENPGFTGIAGEDATAGAFFGEPGMRTIYRRALLIAPWVNPYRTTINGVVNDTFQEGGQTFQAEPGLVRLLPSQVGQGSVPVAIAALIAFQDGYDLSVRLEWDHNIQRWKIMANTLADLTKRENRFGHYGFRQTAGSSAIATRFYPYPITSLGSGYSSNQGDVVLVSDPDVGGPSNAGTPPTAQIQNGLVVSYAVDPANYATGSGIGHAVRPFAFVDGVPGGVPATANVMLNDLGQVVRVVHGPVPLWGERRGEDVMLTSTLAFDVRLYDPGAPLFRHVASETILEPCDQGWRGDPTTVGAYLHADNMGSGAIGTNATNTATFQYVGQGAYVDLGYGYDPRWVQKPQFDPPVYHANFASAAQPWYFVPRALSDVYGNQLSPGYAVYDTWSFHYENNGVNEDDDEVENGMWQKNDGDAVGTPSIDEGTNGLDDYGHYSDGTFIRLGPDDVGERETTPPYDKPLRGVQVLIRAYEPDSRAIRQVRVNQHFLPE